MCVKYRNKAQNPSPSYVSNKGGAVVRAGMGENPLRPTFQGREGGKGLVLGVVNDLKHKYLLKT